MAHCNNDLQFVIFIIFFKEMHYTFDWINVDFIIIIAII